MSKIRSPLFQPKPQTPLSQRRRRCFVLRAGSLYDVRFCILFARAASGSMARLGGKETFAAVRIKVHSAGQTGLVRLRLLLTQHFLAPAAASSRRRRKVHRTGPSPVPTLAVCKPSIRCSQDRPSRSGHRCRSPCQSTHPQTAHFWQASGETRLTVYWLEC